jgi:hypothetical protein
MTTLELALTMLAEATATAIHQAHDSAGLPALREDVREAGTMAGAARRNIEARTGQPVISPENATALTERHRLTQRTGRDAENLATEGREDTEESKA